MSLFDFFRRGYQPEAQTRPLPEPPAPRAELPTGGETFTGLDDPRLLEYIRRGELDGSDPRAAHALRNMAVLRCVTLISEAIGMLPLNLQSSDEKKQVQVDNPAHRLLKYKPNDWQTPIEFKSLMQLRALLDGQSFARVIWSGNRPIRLIPMDRGSTNPRLTAAWQIVYDYTTPAGDLITLPAREVFHLRDLSLDGVNGISRVKLSCEALELAEHAERAASRTFRTGVMAGGAIEVPKELSDNAYKRMKQSLADNYAGADNAGSWMLIEEGGTAKQFTATAVSAQQIETRNHQIEEVARMYGVPRPLLMMDDTSWGSGIEQLAIFSFSTGLHTGSFRGSRLRRAASFPTVSSESSSSSSTRARCCAERSTIRRRFSPRRSAPAARHRGCRKTRFASSLTCRNPTTRRPMRCAIQ